MLLSMTGYGRASREFGDKTIVVEIKSLNGKTTDLRMKMPNQYREKEMDIRKQILDGVERGKIDSNIEVSSELGEGDYGLNKKLFVKYYSELNQLKEDLNIESADLIQSILRIPNVIQSGAEELDENEWKALRETIHEAVDKFIAFRREEGNATKNDLISKVNNILHHMESITPHEIERIELLKTRIKKNLNEFLGSDNVDKNRFEQEVLFYIEKIDINEEKARLTQHCKYFLSELGNSASMKGRKLSFISQEMGREINTLGAKAQNSEIQKLVVKMKDELEQIKEQVANVV